MSFLAAALALAAAAPPSPGRGVALAPPPSWVEAVAPATRPAPPDASGGVDYLLVDDQVRIGSGPAERYHRTVRRVLSPSGVSNASELRVDFDPTYETVALHHVTLGRGGARLEALSAADVKVIQRETELDRRLYDGRLTAVVILRDVRAGDVVDASWTIRGQNPVLGSRWTGSFSLAYGVPVGRLAVRVLSPEGGPLAWRTHGLELAPARAPRDGFVDRRWMRAEIAAVDGEDEVPPGVDALPWLELSEWRSWDEVVRWALPLYLHAAPSPAMSAKVAGWLALGGEDDRARAALRFVQDEVRYLGIELGPGSYRPGEPGEVLARRFGDCKDKSLLLVALLRALGVDAAPALVNTEERASLDGRLPSPAAFDHVVVRARVAGATRWLEPTRSLEHGPVAAVATPPYDRALVIAPGEVALTALPAPTAQPLEVTSTWRVERFRAPVQLEVVTRFDGLRAVGMRHTLAETPAPELQRRWLDHYAHADPGIAVAAPLEVRDEPDADRLTVRERYRLPGIVEGAEREFEAEAIREELRVPKTALRKLPLRIGHPVEIREHIRIELPGAPDLEPDDRTVASDAATLVGRARPEGRSYIVDLEYRTLRPTLEPGAVARHLTQVREIRAATHFSLKLATRRRVEASAFTWGDLGLLATVLLGGAGVVVTVAAAASGDLRRSWGGLRRWRAQRAFAAALHERPGDSPRTAIVVRTTHAVSAHTLRGRCACGAALVADPWTAAPVVYDGRALEVVRLTCARCGAARVQYFSIEP